MWSARRRCTRWREDSALRLCGDHGAVGFGQIDADGYPGLCLDTPTSGRYVLNGTDVSHMDEDELAEVRNKEIGFVSQTFNLQPRYTALENVAVPLIYAGVSKSKRLHRVNEHPALEQ